MNRTLDGLGELLKDQGVADKEIAGTLRLPLQPLVRGGTCTSSGITS